MKKRQKAKYEKEIDECLNKHIKLLVHHLGSIFQRYSREIWKINLRYFDIKEYE